MSPGETPPKKSPIMFPIAEPHAAAGPNRNEHTTGIALAGRSSVTPGISGTTLNGTSTAAYSAAEIAHSTTIRVLLHIRRSSVIAIGPSPTSVLTTPPILDADQYADAAAMIKPA